MSKPYRVVQTPAQIGTISRARIAEAVRALYEKEAKRAERLAKRAASGDADKPRPMHRAVAASQKPA